METIPQNQSNPARGLLYTVLSLPCLWPKPLLEDRIKRLLGAGDLYRLRAEAVADRLHMSGTTMRRKLRIAGTSYRLLLDRERKRRCNLLMDKHWIAGRYLAEELGYLEVNSFYRAFKRWTGKSYSNYCHSPSAPTELKPSIEPLATLSKFAA